MAALASLPSQITARVAPSAYEHRPAIAPGERGSAAGQGTGRAAVTGTPAPPWPQLSRSPAAGPAQARPASPARGGAPAVGRADRSRWPRAPPPAHAQPPGMAAMAPRVLPLPRQESFSPPTILNPFEHPGRLSAGDKLRVRLGGGRERLPRPGRAARGWDAHGSGRRGTAAPGTAQPGRGSEPALRAAPGPPRGCQRCGLGALLACDPPLPGQSTV